MVDYFEPVLSVVVDSRHAIRMIEAQLVPQEYRDFLDLFGRNSHLKPPAAYDVCFLDVGRKGFFQFLDEIIFSFVREAHPCSYTFDLRIFSCSMMIACSKASGLAG